jgi:hypothetical protein
MGCFHASESFCVARSTNAMSALHLLHREGLTICTILLLGVDGTEMRIIVDSMLIDLFARQIDIRSRISEMQQI